MQDLFGEVKRTRKPLVIPECSKPYMPSNGFEGSIFIDYNCTDCRKFSSCTILTRSFHLKRGKDGNIKRPINQWVTLQNGDNVCLSRKEK
jgi:uncharacterized protein (DUF2237 family)